MIEPGKTSLDLHEVMQLVPHRYPMLMIDRLTDIRPGESAVGIKQVTYNEIYFQGHFPQRPVLPGVLMIEAMLQAAAAFTVYTEQLDVKNRIVLFMGLDRARFRKPVVPGDTLKLLVRPVHRRPPVWRYEGKASVDGVPVGEAIFMAMQADARP